MMARATIAGGLLAMLFSAAAFAAGPADVAGVWNLSYTTKEGQKIASTLTLKLEGDKLTGTISSLRGSVPITDVAVNGEAIAFAVVKVGFGDNIRIDYTGKVSGDTMKLKMKAGAREPLDVTVKRGAPPAAPAK